MRFVSDRGVRGTGTGAPLKPEREVAGRCGPLRYGAMATFGAILLATAPAPAGAQRRMAPIPPDKLTQEQKTAAKVYEAARGQPLTRHLFMDLLRVPEVMVAAFQMRDHVQRRNLFGDKLTEFAELITLREWNQRQEWSGHAAIARGLGVEADVITAIAEGRYPKTMTDDEAVIYDFTTELLHTHGVSDTSYARMVRRFGEEGVIETITIASLYTMVGMTLNTVREPLPANYNELPEFPQLKPIAPGTYDHPLSQGPPLSTGPARQAPPPPAPASLPATRH